MNTDRLIRVAQWAAIGVVVIAVLVLGQKLTTGVNIGARVEKANKISSCRAGYRVEVDDATSALNVARSGLDRLTNEGLESSVLGNQGKLLSLAFRAPKERDRVDQAEQRLKNVTKHYQQLVELSREDPDEFLRVCSTQ